MRRHPPNIENWREWELYYASLGNTSNLPLVAGASDIADGAVTLSKYATGTRPIQVVSTRPALPNESVYPNNNSIIFAQDTGKIYRNVSNVWVAAVPTADLTGTITETQISNEAVTSPKIKANTIEASNIKAGTITSNEIATNTIIGGNIYGGTITGDKIAGTTISADKLTFNSLSGLNSSEGSKLSGIADGATKNIVTYSSSEPGSPVNGDIWIDTSVSPYLVKARVSGAWQVGANYSTNTNQLTDGAGLGTTATWTGVSGAGKPADNATKNTLYRQTTQPTGGSYTTGDLWIDTDATPTVVYQYDGASWTQISNYTTNTNQLTDGAGLGTTATWSGVSGAGKPADNADVTLTAVNNTLTVTGGGITLSSGGARICSANKTTYADTDAGFWIGDDSGTAKLNIGDSSKSIKWTGTDLQITGNVIGSGNIQAESITGDHLAVETITANKYAGDGVFALPSATNLKINSATDDQTVEINADNIVLLNSEGVARKIIRVTPDANTILLLHFEESGTTFTDSSTYGHTFTKYGNADRSATQKKFGSYSCYFDGSGDYLQMSDDAHFALGSDWTIDFWFYAAAGASDGCVYSQYVDSTHYVRVYWDSITAQMHFHVNNGLGASSMGTGFYTVYSGAWYHIAFVGAYRSRAFVNGVKVVDQDFSTTIPDFAANIRIGGDEGGMNPINAYIDEFRISNVKRWSSSFTPPTGPYVAPGAISCVLDATNGVNALDIGSLAANTGYYLYFIYNPSTLTLATLASVSNAQMGETPTWPSGYTYWCLVGWCTTDATTTPFNIEEFVHIDDVYTWTTKHKVVDSGGSTTTTAINMAAGQAKSWALCPAAITKGVFGKLLGNANTYTTFIHPVTFTSSIGVDNDVVEVQIVSANTYTYNWALPIISESQKFYYQVQSGNSIDLWVNGFVFKRLIGG